MKTVGGSNTVMVAASMLAYPFDFSVRFYYHHTMKRSLLLSLVILLGLLALSPFSLLAAPGKYNVLFVAVDDLRPELGCYGVSSIKTPHVDGLAARGLLFNRAYCQQAVCNPSRASLMTSLRPESTGVLDLPTHFRAKVPEAVTVAQHFKDQGYFSQRFGKIFHVGHGNYDDKFSWSEQSPPLKAKWSPPPKNAATETKSKKSGKKGVPQIKNEKGEKGPAYAAPDVPDSDLQDGQIADQAIEFLQKHKAEPFFLGVGFLKPHLPFITPKKYWSLYQEKDIPLAVNPFHPHNTPIWTGNNSGELRSYEDIPSVGPVDEKLARVLKHGYFAATSYMDAQLGRVLAELDRLGLREKTVIVFWGDHGWHLGEHDMWCKHTDYEVATRAPLIISVPGQKSAGVKTDALVEFVDVFPSLADVCGLPTPKGLEGTSFKPLLDDPLRPWKKAVFSVWPKKIPEQGAGMGYAMRKDRYRLVDWTVPGKDFHYYELFDHQADPQENENLAAMPQYQSLLKDLLQQQKAGWKAARPH
jgi:arylsulfatase A-like enzyme